MWTVVAMENMMPIVQATPPSFGPKTAKTRVTGSMNGGFPHNCGAGPGETHGFLYPEHGIVLVWIEFAGQKIARRPVGDVVAIA